MTQKLSREENKKNGNTRYLPTGLHVEIDRVRSGISVSVCGVISVLDFTEETAILKLGKGKIKISGSALSIAVYENKIIEISGRVGALEFI